MSVAPAPPSTPRPDASELWSLAETLGIELPQEKHLLHIVRAAMKADLPPNWSAHQTVMPDGSSAPFYFNAKSGQSRWMRPITAANHEALRVARAAGVPAAGTGTVPSSSAATPATTPPHSKAHTPRGGPASATPASAAVGSSSSSTAAASSSSAIATAASTAARFLLSPPSAASSGSATPNASTPGRKSKQASLDASAVAGFSLEIQKDILASFDGASLRCVQMVQRCFRRWRHRKQELIRAKIKVHRATMDKDMMAKLAMGHSASKEKRRTTMEAGASMFLAQAAAAVNSAQQAQGQKGGLQLPASARTTPSTPARTPTGRQSPVSSSPPATSRGHSLLVPGSGSASAYAGMTPEEEAAARAAKKRASMLRMLNIQNRFRADGTVEVVAMPDTAPAAPAASSSAAASSSTPLSTPAKSNSVVFAEEPSRGAGEDGLTSAERRGGSRLNNRRRTFTHEDTEGQASSSGSSSSNGTSSAAAQAQAASPSTSSAAPVPSSGSPRALRPSPSSAAAAALAASSNEALKSWRFLRLVIRAQKRFKAHRAILRARLAEKIAAQQRRQTQDTDRKLRRASLPFSDLSAIRKRLSNQPAQPQAEGGGESNGSK